MFKPVHATRRHYIITCQSRHQKREPMQRIDTGYSRYPKGSPADFLFLHLPLIFISYDEAAQREEETDPDEAFLKDMRIEKGVYQIAMRPKYHHGEEETQRRQRIDHRFSLLPILCQAFNFISYIMFFL